MQSAKSATIKDSYLNSSDVQASDTMLPRQKPRRLWLSATYKLVYLAKALLGPKILLRITTNAAWMFNRFAFEFAGEVYGPDFHTSAQALSVDILQKYVTDKSILDIGCGLGRWCREMTFAKEVVGIDLNPEYIQKAREIGGAEYIVGDLNDLPDRRFDFALLTHVLEHVENRHELLLNIHNVADNLIVEVPDVESDPLNWVRQREGYDFYSDADHVIEYTQDLLLAQLVASNWKVVECIQRNRAILVICSS